MLEMNTDIQEGILIIDIEGALDSRTSADFRSWLLEKILQGHKDILLNFRDLEYLSSAGISALVELNHTLQNQGGKFGLTQVSPEVERLLSFFGILRHIPLVQSLDEFLSLPRKKERPQEETTPSSESPKEEPVKAQSNVEENQSSGPADLNEEKIIPCPNCQNPLRLSRKGKYLCPHCHFVFEH